MISETDRELSFRLAETRRTSSRPYQAEGTFHVRGAKSLIEALGRTSDTASLRLARYVAAETRPGLRGYSPKRTAARQKRLARGRLPRWLLKEMHRAELANRLKKGTEP